MNDNTLDNPFWQYACSLYKKPGVADTLLEMQDHYNANIPLLLFLVWLGTQRIAITAANMQDFTNAIAELDTHAIKPLRNIRRYIKSNAILTSETYVLLKSLELSMEQQVMALLFRLSRSLFASTPDATYCITHNLKTGILTGDDGQLRLARTLLEQVS
jgi:uncharacterized protein (TIGR02444 family)